jgi:DNA invertase Pin-like site-specific DNA recombinase
MSVKVVAYRRVSTQGQGRSGLGLEGQEAAIQSYVQSVGGQVIAAYTEVESGKRSDRPELAKALAQAKRAGAVLVVAKLDRLARNVAFLSALIRSGVDFVACDNPTANKLTIHILAAVAEDEAERISERTKAALAAYKARGGKLGTNNLTDAGRTKGAMNAARAHKERADAAYADLVPAIKAWRSEGATLQTIADRLNAEGHTTRTGKAWGTGQVSKLLTRAGG